MIRRDAIRTIVAGFGCSAMTLVPQLLPLRALAKGTPDVGLGVVHPGDGVVLESVDIRQPLTQSGDGNIFYVVKFKWTNDLGTPVIPEPSRFVLEDDNKVRHAGLETGSPELAGISNDFSARLKAGDTHEYTLGFRVQVETEGTLYYDAATN